MIANLLFAITVQSQNPISEFKNWPRKQNHEFKILSAHFKQIGEKTVITVELNPKANVAPQSLIAIWMEDSQHKSTCIFASIGNKPFITTKYSNNSFYQTDERIQDASWIGEYRHSGSTIIFEIDWRANLMPLELTLSELNSATTNTVADSLKSPSEELMFDSVTQMDASFLLP